MQYYITTVEDLSLNGCICGACKKNFRGHRGQLCATRPRRPGEHNWEAGTEQCSRELEDSHVYICKNCMIEEGLLW